MNPEEVLNSMQFQNVPDELKVSNRFKFKEGETILLKGFYSGDSKHRITKITDNKDGTLTYRLKLL